MPDNQTPEPPDGFWEDFQKWAMSQFASKQAGNEAPAPEPKDPEPVKDEKPKQRKSWFQVDE